jgi:hypothetical protein
MMLVRIETPHVYTPYIQIKQPLTYSWQISLFMVHPDNAYLKQEYAYWISPVWSRRAAELVAE